MAAPCHRANTESVANERALPAPARGLRGPDRLAPVPAASASLPHGGAAPPALRRVPDVGRREYENVDTPCGTWMHGKSRIVGRDDPNGVSAERPFCPARLFPKHFRMCRIILARSTNDVLIVLARKPRGYRCKGKPLVPDQNDLALQSVLGQDIGELNRHRRAVRVVIEVSRGRTNSRGRLGISHPPTGDIRRSKFASSGIVGSSMYCAPAIRGFACNVHRRLRHEQPHQGLPEVGMIADLFLFPLDMGFPVFEKRRNSVRSGNIDFEVSTFGMPLHLHPAGGGGDDARRRNIIVHDDVKKLKGAVDVLRCNRTCPVTVPVRFEVHQSFHGRADRPNPRRRSGIGQIRERYLFSSGHAMASAISLWALHPIMNPHGITVKGTSARAAFRSLTPPARAGGRGAAPRGTCRGRPPSTPPGKGR